MAYRSVRCERYRWMTRWTGQIKAKDMLRRNASKFSKHHLDMGKTNLVKHNIVLTDPIPLKEKYRTIPPQLFRSGQGSLTSNVGTQELLEHSNSTWASAWQC